MRHFICYEKVAPPVVRVLEQVEDGALHPVEVAGEQIQWTVARDAGDLALKGQSRQSSQQTLLCSTKNDDTIA